MQIHGLQKLTFMDYPGKISCSIFTPGCQLRCPFCHNASIAALRTDDQSGVGNFAVLEYIQKRNTLLEGICIGGGEPLLQDDLQNFLYEVKMLGLSVKLDTNGFLPHRLAHLIDQGLLDFIAMDIKNCPSRYANTCGVPSVDLAPVQESIHLIQNSAIDHEFRMTVLRAFHSVESVEEFAAWELRNAPFYLQRFQDTGNSFQPNLTAFSDSEMNNFCKQLQVWIPTTKIRNGNSQNNNPIQNIRESVLQS